METSKTKLGANHPDTLTSIANLTSTDRDQGRWEEAEKLRVQDRRAQFFQAEDGIRDQPRSRGLGDVYKRQVVLFADTFNRIYAVSYTHLTLPTNREV